MRYVPMQWKIAEMIIIPKPDKPLEDRTSYRSISLLPVISKLFERLLLKRLNLLLKNSNFVTVKDSCKKIYFFKELGNGAIKRYVRSYILSDDYLRIGRNDGQTPN